MRYSFQLSVIAFIALCSVNLAAAQWTKVSGLSAKNINAVETVPNGSNGTDLFVAANSGVYISSDGGTSWSVVDNGLVNTHVNALISVPNGKGGATVFAGTNGSGVYRTTDYGAIWESVNNGDLVDGTYVFSFAFVADGSGGGWLFAGTSNSDVFLSTNDGAGWKSVNSGLSGTYVLSLAVVGTNLYAGTDFGGVYVASVYTGADTLAWNSLDSGLPVGTNKVGAFGVSGNNLFSAAGYGVYLYTAAGWTPAYKGLPLPVLSLAVYDSGTGSAKIFAGGYNGNVSISTDNGASWAVLDTGLAKASVQCLYVSGGYLYAGTAGGGLWRRSVSEPVTAVKGYQSGVPRQFGISQNYPNPFNPTTVINYSVAKVSNVSLRIYNVLGQEVETLVDRNQPAGKYSVRFNGSRLASGVYFYRLVAGPHIITKRMLLLK